MDVNYTNCDNHFSIHIKMKLSCIYEYIIYLCLCIYVYVYMYMNIHNICVCFIVVHFLIKIQHKIEIITDALISIYPFKCHLKFMRICTLGFL